MDLIASFRKNLTYDNIKSHKKSGLHPLSRKQILEKTIERRGQINLPSSFRVNLILS